ncbi:MAG: tRNA (adenosine(37)-N6)-threonylcarbamoyltransferase complex transferase subunit TsaD, partial [Fimbriimonadales bacterium]
GEAFDKVARLLGLGYPGGPAIDQRARQGNPNAFAFPRARVQAHHFSFSGLKTAVRREVERLQAQNALNEAVLNDLCASFQQAVLDMLIEKTLAAAYAYGVKTLTVVGGVAANSALQTQMRAACAQAGLNLKIPPAHYCTDNAAMIALAGYFRLLAGERADYDLDAYANAPLGS